MSSFIAFPNHYYVSFSRVDGVMVKHTSDTIAVEFEIYGFENNLLISIHADTTRLTARAIDRMKMSIAHELSTIEGVITDKTVALTIDKFWVQARALSEVSSS